MAETRPDLSSHKRIFCNNCRIATNHSVKCDHIRKEGGAEYLYRFWICAGCESATLEECAGVYADEREDVVEVLETNYFPKRMVYDIEAKRFIQLPKVLGAIYRESIQAFNNQLYVLCAAGLRTLIEGVCANKRIKGKTLEEKINGLVALLPQNIVESLHSFRFMGNEALHEMTAPKSGDLRLAIEVSEDLLNYLYELDYKAKRLSYGLRNRPKTNGG